MGSLRRDLERIYDGLARQLFTWALAVTRCRSLAEHAVHDAFHRLLSLKEAPANLKVYVFGSVRNGAVDLIRKTSRTVALTDDYIFDTSPGPREAAETDEFKHRVAECLTETISR